MKVAVRSAAFVLVSVLALVLTAGGPAAGDVVYYRDGGSQEGKVVRLTDTEVWLEVALATGKALVKIPRDNVARIERGETTAEKLERWYRERLARMDASDPAAWYRLGEWCSRWPLLRKKAREAFERAVSLDPDYAPAHIRLGHVKYRGVWMTYDEMMRARGYVKYKGEWMTVEGRTALVLKEKELELLREKRRFEEAQARRLEAERALAEARKAPPSPPRAAASAAPSVVIVRERVLSPLWWDCLSPPVVIRGRGCPPPYYIRYPYRRWYRGPARCSGISVSYSRRTSHSSLRVGFFFR